MATFTGHGGTFEEAFDSAAADALKSWKPAGPDDMAVVEVKKLSALYGGIVGFTGARVVEVALAGRSQTKSFMDASGAKLVLRLDVIPDRFTANLLPPVHRPQKATAALVLTVVNVGSAPYSGQAPSSAVAQFAVLRGRTQVWQDPAVVMPVVTPVTLAPGEARSYVSRWDIPDLVDLAGADLTVVARFTPSQDSAIHKVVVEGTH